MSFLDNPELRNLDVNSFRDDTTTQCCLCVYDAGHEPNHDGGRDYEVECERRSVVFALIHWSQ